MGELLTSKLNVSRDKAVELLSQDGPMDFQLFDGKTAVIPAGMTSRCMYIIKEE